MKLNIMNFLAALLRFLSIIVFIIGYFTLIVLIGFLFLMLAKDMNIWADKLTAVPN